MAVYAAHLTRTLQGTPSIFQITAQDALGSTIKPAFKKVIEYLSELYGDKFRVLLTWYDELYLLMDACLQHHYLKHYAASFSESFYGLHRVPVTSSQEFSASSRLSSGLERASLATLVLLPYLDDKCRQYADQWRADDEEGRLGKDTGGSVRRAAYKLHALVHLACSGARLVQLARYLCSAPPGPPALPSLAVLGLRLLPAPPAERHHWTDIIAALKAGRLGWSSLTFPMLGGVALGAVEYVAFFVQFLRWWEMNPGTAIAPPPPEHTLQRQPIAPHLRNKCPVCLQPWRTPTVLPVSGLVFCYACISRSLSRSPSCPVTKLPATAASLIRMYVD